jgi:hypothetical protein
MAIRNLFMSNMSKKSGNIFMDNVSEGWPMHKQVFERSDQSLFRCEKAHGLVGALRVL